MASPTQSHALVSRRRASANAANLKKLRGRETELIDSNTGVFFNAADAPAREK